MAIAVASRYARALADVVAEQKGDYRRVGGEIAAFAALYRESGELREVLETPAVPLPAKLRVLAAIEARLAASPVTGNFLRVLASHYRMALLGEIAQVFRRLSNQRLGGVEVRVTSTGALSEPEQQALHGRFKDLTGKEVEFDFHSDDRLLGGIVAQIGSTVYDGSVRGQLDRIRQRLTEQ